MWRIGMIVLVVFFAGVAYSNPPSPAPPKATHKPEANPTQHEEAPAKDQRGTESSPVFIKVIPPTTVEPEASKEHEKATDDSSAEWWLVYVTGVLCAITLALAFFTGWLWNATKKLVIGAEKTAKHELRAYVGVEQVAIEMGGKKHRGVFVIKNFGKTMAKSMVIRINGTMIVGDITDFPLDDGNIKSKTVAMPNESLGGIEQPITSISDSGSHIYLWGQIDYEDVFGVPHWTRFRFVDYKQTYTSRTVFDKPMPFPSGWDVKTCDEGNEADDN